MFEALSGLGKNVTTSRVARGDGPDGVLA